MFELSTSLIEELIAAVIVSALSWLVIYILKVRRQSRFAKLLANVAEEFGRVRISSPDRAGMIERVSKELRDKAVSLVKRNKINKQMFIDLNDTINTNLDKLRVEYIQYLLSDVLRDSGKLKLILSDKVVTKDEVNQLIDAIGKLQSISEEKKRSYISELTRSYLDNNKIKDSTEFYNSINPEKYYIRRSLRLAAAALPTLLVAGFILMNVLRRPDFVFGAIGYVQKNKFDASTKKMETYFAQKFEKTVKFKYYSYDDVDRLITDLQLDRVQGLILNPGTYQYVYVNRPEFLKTVEVFAHHKQEGKSFYRSTLITDKNRFLGYCNRIGENLDFFTADSLSNSAKSFMKGYLQEGDLLFTHRNSMSGYLLPVKYLWSEFHINVKSADSREQGLRVGFSGDHDLSVRDILSGRHHVAAVYNDLLTTSYQDDLANIFILYRSQKIPYNSYWYKKNTDTTMTTLLREAFESMNTSEEVKDNPLKIDGWVLCTTSEYHDKIAESLDIIGTPLHKPDVVFKTDESLAVVLSIVKSNLEKIGAWHIPAGKESHFASKIYEIELRLTKDSIQKDQEILHGLIATLGSETQHFVINVDTLKEKIPAEAMYDSLAYRSLEQILTYISPRAKIYDDVHGLFLNIGKEDGLRNCQLLLDGENKIIPHEKYTIESGITRFKLTGDEIEDYRDKVVLVKYDLRSLVSSSDLTAK